MMSHRISRAIPRWASPLGLGAAYVALNLGVDALHYIFGDDSWMTGVLVVRIGLGIAATLVSARVRDDDLVETGVLIGVMVAAHLLLLNLHAQVTEHGTAWAVLGSLPLLLVVLLRPIAIATAAAIAIAWLVKPTSVAGRDRQ